MHLCRAILLSVLLSGPGSSLIAVGTTPAHAEEGACTGQNCQPKADGPEEECTGQDCDTTPVEKCSGEDCTPTPESPPEPEDNSVDQPAN
jgi:hypothetical protein